MSQVFKVLNRHQSLRNSQVWQKYVEHKRLLSCKLRATELDVLVE